MRHSQWFDRYWSLMPKFQSQRVLFRYFPNVVRYWKISKTVSKRYEMLISFCKLIRWSTKKPIATPTQSELESGLLCSAQKFHILPQTFSCDKELPSCKFRDREREIVRSNDSPRRQLTTPTTIFMISCFETFKYHMTKCISNTWISYWFFPKFVPEFDNICLLQTRMSGFKVLWQSSPLDLSVQIWARVDVSEQLLVIAELFVALCRVVIPVK